LYPREAARLHYFIERNTECVCHSLALSRNSFQAITDVADLDEFRGVAMARAVFSNSTCCCALFIKRNSLPGWV
jgi:hypothetical protein